MEYNETITLSQLMPIKLWKGNGCGVSEFGNNQYSMET